jgi:hypothetical protein
MQNQNRRMVIIGQHIYGDSHTPRYVWMWERRYCYFPPSPSPLPLPLRNIRYNAGCNSVGAWRWFSVHIQEYLRTFLIMVQNHMVPCA